MFADWVPIISRVQSYSGKIVVTIFIVSAFFEAWAFLAFGFANDDETKAVSRIDAVIIYFVIDILLLHIIL